MDELTTDKTQDFKLFPKLPFMEFWIHDSFLSDINPKNCTNLSVLPLTWSEFNKMPAGMTVVNTGHERNLNLFDVLCIDNM